jgi:quinol monooxygenase YgiN
MYMRLVQAKMKPGMLPQVKEVYEKKIIPALQATEGCLHISLLQNDSHPEEYISLSLWRQRRHADAYESSGLFSEFVAAVAPFSAGSSEYELHLGPDLSLQYDPVPEPPLIKAFDLPVGSPSAIVPRDPKKSIFLRIVTPRGNDGRISIGLHEGGPPEYPRGAGLPSGAPRRKRQTAPSGHFTHDLAQ